MYYLFKCLSFSASPPKFVSFEQLMQAADGVTNMKLAHEIAVDADFKFEKMETDENRYYFVICWGSTSS